MATILTFQPTPNGARHVASSAEMGKLLLFTGIRYEREADAPDERPRGRRVKSRRRS